MGAVGAAFLEDDDVDPLPVVLVGLHEAPAELDQVLGVVIVELDRPEGIALGVAVERDVSVDAGRLQVGARPAVGAVQLHVVLAVVLDLVVAIEVVAEGELPVVGAIAEDGEEGGGVGGNGVGRGPAGAGDGVGAGVRAGGGGEARPLACGLAGPGDGEASEIGFWAPGVLGQEPLVRREPLAVEGLVQVVPEEAELEEGARAGVRPRQRFRRGIRPLEFCGFPRKAEGCLAQGADRLGRRSAGRQGQRNTEEERDQRDPCPAHGEHAGAATRAYSMPRRRILPRRVVRLMLRIRAACERFPDARASAPAMSRFSCSTTDEVYPAVWARAADCSRDARRAIVESSARSVPPSAVRRTSRCTSWRSSRTLPGQL